MCVCRHVFTCVCACVDCEFFRDNFGDYGSGLSLIWLPTRSGMLGSQLANKNGTFSPSHYQNKHMCVYIHNVFASNELISVAILFLYTDSPFRLSLLIFLS